MKKFLKWTGIILGLTTLVLILTVLTVVTCISPNHFKPMLIAQMMNYTGRQFTLEGQLSWTLFPHFGIKADHVIVNNPPSFKQPILAEIEHVTLGIKLMPLLHKKIESDGITLDGMHLNLIKDIEGHTNWGTRMSSSQPRDYEADVSESTTKMLPTMPFAVQISSFRITNSEIHWLDELNKNSVVIDHFELNAKDINFLNPFMISSKFDFLNNKKKLSGHVDFSSEFTMNWVNQIFSFKDIELKTKIQKRKNIYPVTLTGDLIGNLNANTLVWEHLQGSIDNMILGGELSIKQFINSPEIKLTLQTKPFNLREWLQKTGEDVTDIQALNNVRYDLEITSVNDLMHVKGRILAKEVELHNIKLSDVTIPFEYGRGILDVSSLTGKTYQGQLDAHVKYTLGIEPNLSIDGKLSNIEIAELLKVLGNEHSKMKLQGKGSVDLNVSSRGLRKEVLLKNLNGSGRLNISNGILKGIDIGYYLDTARYFLKGQAAKKENTNQTEFKSLSGTMQIQNGIIYNHDLIVNSDWFKTIGQGQINMVTQQLEYQLQTTMNAEENKINDWKNLYGVTIPITLSGPLSHPNTRLETHDLVKVASNEEFKKVRKKWENKIRNFLGQ